MKKIISIIATVLTASLLLSSNIYAETNKSDDIHEHDVYYMQTISQESSADIPVFTTSSCSHNTKVKAKYHENAHYTGHKGCLALVYEGYKCSNCGIWVSDLILVSSFLLPDCKGEIWLSPIRPQ